MKGYRISLIRHGRTEANDKGIYIGRTDYPLSQKGISELYNKLDEFEYPHVGKVYSSPLQRCTETAEILFPDSSVQIVENLIEMDFGDFEGKSADELVKKPEFLEWLKGGADSRPPKGNFRDFLLGEVRFSSLQKLFPEEAEALFEKTERDAMERRQNYVRLQKSFDMEIKERKEKEAAEKAEK